METLSLSDILNINREKAFYIISSIERYPEYVPGYKKVILLKKNKEYIKAEIVPTIPISNIIMEAYLKPFNEISFKQIKGPLDIFEGKWELEEIDKNTTKINFQLQYFVKKFILRKVVYKFVKISFRDIITSFKIMSKKV